MIDGVGIMFTVTVTVVVSSQVPLVPTTVYVCVLVGDAVTVAPVVPLNPVAGLHTYEPAPLAVIPTLLPAHTAGLAGETDMVISASTFTSAVAVLVHPLCVPVTVYVCVLVGEAATVAPVVPLNPVAGDHEYVVAPLAVSVVLPPVQMVLESGVTVITGSGVTVTVVVAVDEQLPVVPVTVYVVVLVGLAVTFAPVVPLKPVAGDQL